MDHQHVSVSPLQHIHLPSWFQLCQSAFSYKSNPPSCLYFSSHFYDDVYKKDSALSSSASSLAPSCSSVVDDIIVATSCTNGISAENSAPILCATARIFHRPMLLPHRLIKNKKTSTCQCSDESRIVTILGVGEVCTHPNFQGKGLSSLVLKKLHERIDAFSVKDGTSISILHADPQFQNYYAKFGYKQIPNGVRYVSMTFKKGNNDDCATSMNSAFMSLPKYMKVESVNDLKSFMMKKGASSKGREICMLSGLANNLVAAQFSEIWNATIIPSESLSSSKNAGIPCRCPLLLSKKVVIGRIPRPAHFFTTWYSNDFQRNYGNPGSGVDVKFFVITTTKKEVLNNGENCIIKQRLIEYYKLGNNLHSEEIKHDTNISKDDEDDHDSPIILAWLYARGNFSALEAKEEVSESRKSILFQCRDFGINPILFSPIDNVVASDFDDEVISANKKANAAIASTVISTLCQQIYSTNSSNNLNGDKDDAAEVDEGETVAEWGVKFPSRILEDLEVIVPDNIDKSTDFGWMWRKGGSDDDDKYFGIEGGDFEVLVFPIDSF